MRAGRAAADRQQILETIGVSAAAVEELRNNGGGEPPAELLEARFLRAMERYYSGDHEAAFRQLSELLAPRFQRQLRRKIWLQVYEYAGYAAMTVRDIETAAELFSAIPQQSRSDEVRRLLASAPAISAP